MEYFPAADPIPLPAPLWLFKLLHNLTMVLHFGAVHFLIGGLLCATAWSLYARSGRSPAVREASEEVSHRLPVIMAYVINLGVPPLLFAQVLYGRALYTSSVLIGAYWISVVFMVMFSYFLLYQMSARADRGARFGWIGLLASVVVLKVGMIYSTNMSLMLRPDEWKPMYDQSALGTVLPFASTVALPRWAFMMAGSLAIGGLGLCLVALRPGASSAARRVLRRTGGALMILFVAVQAFCGAWVLREQPHGVLDGLAHSTLLSGSLYAWLLTAFALAALGIATIALPARAARITALASFAAFLNVGAMVIVRDGIRDISLAQHGFQVWAQPVNTNWSIVALFLVLFVAGGALVGWMAQVTFRAKGDQHYA